MHTIIIIFRTGRLKTYVKKIIFRFRVNFRLATKCFWDSIVMWLWIQCRKNNKQILKTHFQYVSITIKRRSIQFKRKLSPYITQHDKHKCRMSNIENPIQQHTKQYLYFVTYYTHTHANAYNNLIGIEMWLWVVHCTMWLWYSMPLILVFTELAYPFENCLQIDNIHRFVLFICVPSSVGNIKHSMYKAIMNIN